MYKCSVELWDIIVEHTSVCYVSELIAG